MEEPIRILQVVTQMHRAGLETMLMNYYCNIDRSRVQFDFLVHRSETYDYDSEIESLGGHIYHVKPITPRGFKAYLSELDSFFASHKEHKIVHAHLDALSAFVLRAAKNAGVPVRIAHSHNNAFDKDKKLPLRYAARALIPLYANQYMGCSADALKFMFGEKIAACQRAKVLPNAIDVEAFSFSQEKRRAARKELGLGDELVVGHIGRFGYQKNHGFLIDIFEALYKQQSDAVLLLIGDGEDRFAIEQKVKTLGLEQNVRLLGVRKDIPKLLSAMDVFLLPSRFEGFSVVLIEAQTNGVPCIVSNTIKRDNDISGKICFCSLGASPQDWAQKIIASVGLRYDETDKISAAGFDIRKQSKLLAARYLALAAQRIESR